MRKELKTFNPSLAGGTELVVRARLRKGLVPSLESVTYRSRTQALLRTLHAGRRGSHEYQLFRAMSDAVERVGVIHSVRVAVLEPQDEVMLSVNFDGAFESYVRVIWQKASRLLDLIFCNTENYQLGWRSSYAVWREWLESVRVETPFFYAPPGQTHHDGQYLALYEHLQRRGADAVALGRLAMPNAEEIAWDVVAKTTEPGTGGDPDDRRAGLRAAIRQGLQSLAGLYRLADLYPPGTVDGQVLLDAAHELLPEFARLQTVEEFAEATDRAATRFHDQLAWFRQSNPLPAARMPPQLVDSPRLPLDDVQGGVLVPFPQVSHGLLCLVGLDTPAGAAELIETALQVLGSAADPPPPGGVAMNLAFTAEGLRACGLTEQAMESLPHEFRDGMAARCGLLGDMRHNHPRRWTLPALNWPDGLDPAWSASQDTPRVPMESVHVLLQWRWIADKGASTERASDPAAPTKALAEAARQLLDGLAGVRPLSVQCMSRVDTDGRPMDHFGFADGQSQPVYDRASAGSIYPNRIAPGEVLVGHDNAADHAADLPENREPARGWMRNGSYLVVRKLGLDTDAFRRSVNAAVDANGIDRALVLAKLMGRWPKDSPHAGLPLASVSRDEPNDFDFSADPEGARCPLAAHIRLANPRRPVLTEGANAGDLTDLPGGRPPRIVRCGLPYGPKAPAWPQAGTEGPLDDGADRGLVFMAYNASIAEQFEVVQRWLSGGNSTGIVSDHADPLLGSARPGRTRVFRFEHEGNVVRVPLDGSPSLDAPVRSITRLQWGLYLFAPARGGLQWLAQQARNVRAQTRPAPWDAAAGERIVGQLQQMARDQGDDIAALGWKAALEDPEDIAEWRSASVWAAIRQFHGGALRTPYGVLVASAPLVDQVLRNANGNVSVDGYQQRLRESIGEIYLGLDDGQAYQQQSEACNRAIMALTFDEGFNRAFVAAEDALGRFIQDARERAGEELADRWELALDARELIDEVLAALCEAWFGLSTAGGHFARGGFRWATGGMAGDDTPRYPGHFTAASRATFQPWPGDLARGLASSQGQTVRKAMQAFLIQNVSTPAPVTREVLADLTAQAGPGGQPDFDLAARTIAGALMGFLPTTGGNLRRILADWLQDGTLAALRTTHPTRAGWIQPAEARQRMHHRLLETMQARPVPELVWRSARRGHVLQSQPEASGTACHVEPGDRVVLALVSATQQALETGGGDLMPIFGGRRDGPGAPTHACPGYRVAMGVVVGVLSAVAVVQGPLRSGPAPGVLYLDGPMSKPEPSQGVSTGIAPAVAAAQAWSLKSMDGILTLPLPWIGMPAMDARRKRSARRLLGWGDSWIRNPLSEGRSLRDALRVKGYGTDAMGTFASFGLTLAQMASDDPESANQDSIWQQIRQALVAADDPVEPTPLPLAVIISGGGNDVHKKGKDGRRPLHAMLNDKATDSPMFNDGKDQFIKQRLAEDLRTVLRRLVKATAQRIPVLVTAYDYPVPDARTTHVGVGPWLEPLISSRGYDTRDGRLIMRKLITDLNHQVELVVGEFNSQNVHHAKLTDTLQSTDHRADWGDELHPTEAGFTALANKLETFIPQAP